MSVSQLQLEPPLWIQTPKGEGFAIIHIDYGMNQNGVFLVHLHETGEYLYFDIKDCRGVENLTYGVERPDKPNQYYKNNNQHFKKNIENGIGQE